MNRRVLRRALGCAIVLVVVAITALAFARPGGGDSYGGGGGGGGGDDGGGGGGGGGSGDGGLVVYLLVQLAIERPYIGVPLLLLVGVAFFYGRRNVARSRARGWTAGAAAPRAPIVAPPRTESVSAGFDRIRAHDENFSRTLLEDFLYALYAAVHHARGRGEIGAMMAYFADGALACYGAIPGLTEVKGIIVGAMRFDGAYVQPNGDAILRVTFESNYVEVVGQQEQTFYAEERWTLFRKAGVLSRTPDRARNVACPHCGAPLQAISIEGGTCRYCKTRVNGGDFDWVVREVIVVRREPRPPQLTSDAPEVGTDWPTIVDPRAREEFRRLCALDPAFSWTTFEARVRLVHKTLNEGWSARDFLRVRPFVTDNLFQMQTYWIDAYRKAHLVNVLERARVAKVETAKVVIDRFFVAITVRVFATGLDYVMEEGGGKILRGSDVQERLYSEYWTFIRSVQARGAGRSDPACPRCGAPLKVNMAGSCEYCHAAITTGEFDWVLSRIEQDESYAG